MRPRNDRPGDRIVGELYGLAARCNGIGPQLEAADQAFAGMRRDASLKGRADIGAVQHHGRGGVIALDDLDQNIAATDAVGARR
jgi:hypothetical protein